MKVFLKKNYVYISIILCSLIMLWRAFMGFCWTDESFYISTADRFYKGGLPLVDEWYRTQLSSILMLPFYHIYMLVVGSVAGMVLYFRILYLIVSICVSVLIYRVLRNDYPDFAAGGAALFVLCFAHLNMATFSYYMMSYIFLLAALILVYDHKNHAGRTRLVVAGVLTALAVMSMPAFVIVYVLIMAAVFAVMIIGRSKAVSKKTAESIRQLDLGRITLWTIAGIAIPALLFLVYLFMHTDIDYLTGTLPYVLTDSEHSSTLGYLIRKPHRCMMSVFGIYTWAAYALISVSFVFQRILKKHPLRELTILAAAVLFALMTYISFGHVGYVSVAFFVFIIPVYFVSEHKNHALFALMVIPAALVALVYCFASSDFLYIMALGFALANGAGICMVYDLCSGIRQNDGKTPGTLSRICIVAAGCVCVVTLVITFALRITNVYRDAPLDRLTERIPSGIAKGIYTTPEHLDQYMDVMEVIDGYCMNTDKFEVISQKAQGNVLFSKILPWGYAAANLDCGYPTTWRSTAYNSDQLELYYKLNPSSRPDVIIVLDSQYGSYDASGDVEDDHEPNLDEMSDYWKEYISNNGFTETRVKCGRVYCRSK